MCGAEAPKEVTSLCYLQCEYVIDVKCMLYRGNFDITLSRMVELNCQWAIIEVLRIPVVLVDSSYFVRILFYVRFLLL